MPQTAAEISTRGAQPRTEAALGDSGEEGAHLSTAGRSPNSTARPKPLQDAIPATPTHPC